MKRSIYSFLAWAASFFGAATLLAIILYTALNDTGHTGFDPWAATFIFLPVSITGLITWLRLRSASLSVRPAVYSLITGIAGMIFLILIDRMNILLEYEVWIQRGMP